MKVQQQAKAGIVLNTTGEEAMTFEEYMRAVIDYYMIGGTTWEASYWRMLAKHKPEMTEQVERVGLNPTAPFVNLGDFLHLVYTSWEK